MVKFILGFFWKKTDFKIFWQKFSLLLLLLLMFIRIIMFVRICCFLFVNSSFTCTIIIFGCCCYYEVEKRFINDQKMINVCEKNAHRERERERANMLIHFSFNQPKPLWISIVQHGKLEGEIKNYGISFLQKWMKWMDECLKP